MIRSMFILMLLVFLVCKNSTDPDDCSTIAEGKSIELITPTGGESFKIGQRVPLKWKVDIDKVQDQVRVAVSTKGSTGPWLDIFKYAIDLPDPEGKRVICMDTTWTIGKGDDNIDYNPPVTILLRVGKYNEENEINDVSRMINLNE